MSNGMRILALVLAGLMPVAALGEPGVAGHYLFAWAGDSEGKGNDFLAVVDADPASATYGSVVASVDAGIATRQVHHTEYWMPMSGFLFANDHTAGRTAILDLRDPLHPSVHARFGDLGGFSHPHSFLRLPNGHVLASFQVEGHGMGHGMPMDHESVMSLEEAASGKGVHGGVVEIDDDGHLVRAASTADPAHAADLLMAYSLLPLPDIDRLIVTNSSMRDEDHIGNTYQVFRLSDLKLLSTNAFDRGKGGYGEVNPEEARLGPDGAVYVQTVGCGIERVTGLAAKPASRLVYQFPGMFCGVPTIVSHFLIQTVPLQHAVVVLDIAHGETPVEVSRVRLGDALFTHWTAYDAITHRIAVSGGGEDRIYLLTFDPQTGAITVDAAFHDAAGKAGMNVADRTWPHGWKGTAKVHGIVFSRS